MEIFIVFHLSFAMRTSNICQKNVWSRGLHFELVLKEPRSQKPKKPLSPSLSLSLSLSISLNLFDFYNFPFLQSLNFSFLRPQTLLISHLPFFTLNSLFLIFSSFSPFYVLKFGCNWISLGIFLQFNDIEI